MPRHILPLIKPNKKILAIIDFSKEMIQFVSDRQGHDLRYAIDFKKEKNEPGRRPVYNFSKGLKKTINWHYKENTE